MRGAAKRTGPSPSPATASPLLRAARWTVHPAGRPLLAWVVILAGLTLLLASVGVSHACNHPPPPIMHAESGTPRERYCSTVQGVGVGWLCFAAPLLVLGLGVVALRRATIPSVVLAIAISAAAVVNAMIVSDLRAIQVVPGINARIAPDRAPLAGLARRAYRPPARTDESPSAEESLLP